MFTFTSRSSLEDLLTYLLTISGGAKVCINARPSPATVEEIAETIWRLPLHLIPEKITSIVVGYNAVYLETPTLYYRISPRTVEIVCNNFFNLLLPGIIRLPRSIDAVKRLFLEFQRHNLFPDKVTKAISDFILNLPDDINCHLDLPLLYTFDKIKWCEVTSNLFNVPTIFYSKDSIHVDPRLILEMKIVEKIVDNVLKEYPRSIIAFNIIPPLLPFFDLPFDILEITAIIPEEQLVLNIVPYLSSPEINVRAITYSKNNSKFSEQYKNAEIRYYFLDSERIRRMRPLIRKIVKLVRKWKDMY